MSIPEDAAGPGSVEKPGPLLDGLSAVVTGGAAGIGGAISRAFAAHGAHVLVVDRDEEAIAALAAAVAGRAAGGAVSTLVQDVTHPDSAAAIRDACEPDIVVNNVGHFVYPSEEFHASGREQWEELDRVNLRHVFETTHALLPGMIGRGRGGSIINLSTVEAFRGIPGFAVYSAYKAAVCEFTRSLAVEVGKHAIRVNDIAPDVVETPQLPYSDWVPVDERWRWSTWVPLSRVGSPDDVAGAALFLASSLSSFVTGSTVHVDGGTKAAGGWYPRHRGGWTNRPTDP